ncbi:hypothetical protein FQN54_001447 [Arachnomyces sp. PD_36]|nr:hypothetical protein FQN54_001447 [Arachnomyces sp. PD_36]
MNASTGGNRMSRIWPQEQFGRGNNDVIPRSRFEKRSMSFGIFTFNHLAQRQLNLEEEKLGIPPISQVQSMFDLPDAKRVRRDELNSPAPSSPPLSPNDLSETYPANAGLDKFFSLETFTVPETEVEKNDGNGDDEQMKDADGGDSRPEQEFEFRLFRAPVGKREESRGKDTDGGRGSSQKAGDTAVHATKIRIRSPTPAGEGGEGSDGRFVVPFRGWGFYFSDPERMVGEVGYVPQRGGGSGSETMEKRRREFFDAAIGGEEVLARKGEAWPGCHLPWRVTHIKATPSTTTKPKPKSKPSSTASPTPKQLLFKNKDVAASLKRKNLGKKRRIILRKALAAQEAAKEADQEKRTRRNREKKIKRRQREREKKATAAGDATADSGAGVESDSGSE